MVNWVMKAIKDYLLLNLEATLAGDTETNKKIADAIEDAKKNAKDNEEKISIVSSTKDALIAPKIQSLISELLQEYFEEARFHVPEADLLDMSAYKKTILRSPQTLTLYPAVDKILNPIKATKQVDWGGGGGGGGGTRGKDKKGDQIKFDEHKEQELCGGKKYFHQVIQKNGLHLTSIPKPMFNDNLEECGKY